MSNDLALDIAGFNFSDSESTEDSLIFLEACIIYDDLETVKNFFLKNLDLDINKKYQDGNTLLHWACQSDSLAIVKFLIKHGSNINIKNASENTPIQEALESDSEFIVKYFIKKGFNLPQIKSFFYKAQKKVFYTISDNDISKLKFYIKFGVLIKSKHVRYALKYGNLDIYKFLKKVCSEPIFYSYNISDKLYWP